MRVSGQTLPEVGAGDVVLALGEPALKACKAAGLVPKNRILNSVQGEALPFGGAHLVLGPDPNARFHDPEQAYHAVWAFKLARRLAQTGQVERPDRQYR